jgi:hypothetical protein
METPTPQALPEQQLSPEELLAQRLDFLYDLHPFAVNYYGDLPTEGILDKFLGHQTFGLRTDFEAAIRGPREDFNSYLADIGRTNHEELARSPQVFSSAMAPSEMEALIGNYLKLEVDDEGGWKYFPVVAEYMTAEDRDAYVASTQFQMRYKSRLTPRMIKCLHEYELVPADDLREAALVCLQQNASFWLNTIDAYHSAKIPDERYYQKNHAGALDISYLMENGILTQAEIVANLQLRRTDAYVHTIHDREAARNKIVIAREATIAHRLLMGHGVLPDTNGDTTDLQARLLALIQTGKVDDFSELQDPINLARNYYVCGVLSKNELKSVLIAAEPGMTVQQRIDLHELAVKTLGDTEWAKQIFPCFVEQMYQQVVVDGQEFADITDFPARELLLHDVHTDTAKQRELLQLTLGNEPISIVRRLQTAKEIFADDIDALRNLIEQTLSDIPSVSDSSDMVDWDILAEVMGYTPEQTNELLLKMLTDNELILHSFGTYLEATNLNLTGRFGQEQLTAIAFDRLLKGSELTDIHRALRNVVCQLFDRAQAGDFLANYLEQVSTAFPVIVKANLLQYVDTGACIRKICAADNYIDLVNTAYDINQWASFCDNATREMFCQRILQQTEPKDMFYLTRQLWPFIDATTKESIIERWYKNPAEARYLGEKAYFGDLRKSLGHNAMIAAEPYVSPLERLCPATSHAISRRINSKPLYRPVDYNLSSQYAYHYDLAAQLEESPIAGDLDLLMRQMGTKNNEKSELHSMETLLLIGQNCPSEELPYLIGKTKSELEHIAWTSTLTDYGITDRQQHAAFQTSLTRQGVDIIKFSTWMQKSKSHYDVTKYLRSFLEFTASGGTLQQWKFDTDADTIELFPAAVTAEQLTAWKAETHSPIILSGKTYDFRTTHDLGAVYQSGARPNANCLHYGYGINMHALPSLLSPEVKMIEILNSKRNPVGNAILRMAESSGHPVLVIEPLYHAFTDRFDAAEANRAMAHVIHQYGASMGVPTALLDVWNGATDQALQLSSWLITAEEKGQDTLLNPRILRATVKAGASPYAYFDNAGISKKGRTVININPLLLRGQQG